MSTFNEMVASVAADLSDPLNKTFGVAQIGDYINDGLSEVGRIAPARLHLDITPTVDTLTYTLLDGSPDIEVRRVEVWDHSVTPISYMKTFTPASGEYVDASVTGWFFWDGTLQLTNLQESFIDPAIHHIHVWGYGPYVEVSGDTAMPVTRELEWAIRLYARVAGLRTLVNMRNLFAQWQGSSGDTNITSAQLLANLNEAENAWMTRAKAIMVLREGI